MSSINDTGAAVPSPATPKFNPSMAIIIVVLIGACLAVAIFSMYIRRCTQGSDENSSRNIARRSQSIHFYERPGEGLARAVIDSLPLVSFSVVKALKDGKEDLECTVCLESFEEDESLRLLPKCSHVFHTECIDAWFISHSTCPLCRTSLKPTADELNAGVPAVGEVSRRLLEAQEELFGSARQESGRETIIDEDEVMDGISREVGCDIERENERNSARLTTLRKLDRNSDSFKRAARGVKVRERLATLSARYPSSSADFHAEPQGCIHLSLQRTGSSNARGAGDFDSGEVFRYGSLRYGAPGLSLSKSLGRLGSLNEREQQEPGDQSNVKRSETVEEEGDSSTSEHWVTLDVGVASTYNSPKTRSALVGCDNSDASSAIPDTRVLLGKPRSGPLAGKQMNAAHRKSGSTWEQRVMTDRGSFRRLRSSFSLHRSASEGRAQMVEIEPLPTAPAVEMDNATTLAQRTMQWLSGGNRHTRSSSGRGSLEERNNALQQIVTE
ncbi:hypothetical protein KC19_6G116100 [Ceratodon purpureus]|uniref:RING-type E3 ubiquitin transferase n=1 Tax=Ceratodon purpureus TaxID=3225 RepID=A0A8T0HES0_CERPU|nr:hypothetical protein KC19_6G116100 [Ceratodon purpureus]